MYNHRLNVYVATAYSLASDVRDLHAIIRDGQHYPTSSWAEFAYSHEERLAHRSLTENRAMAARNDYDLLASDLVVMIPVFMGKESFSEVRLALANKIPVLWIGYPISLSAFREGVYVTPAESHEEVVQAWRNYNNEIGNVPRPFFSSKKSMLWNLHEEWSKISVREVVGKSLLNRLRLMCKIGTPVETDRPSESADGLGR